MKTASRFDLTLSSTLSGLLALVVVGCADLNENTSSVTDQAATVSEAAAALAATAPKITELDPACMTSTMSTQPATSGSGIAKYELYRNEVLIRTLATLPSRLSDSTFPRSPNTRYTYQLKAYSKSGDFVLSSNKKSFTYTAELCAAPSEMRAHVLLTTCQKPIEISWSDMVNGLFGATQSAASYLAAVSSSKFELVQGFVSEWSHVHCSDNYDPHTGLFTGGLSREAKTGLAYAMAAYNHQHGKPDLWIVVPNRMGGGAAGFANHDGPAIENVIVVGGHDFVSSKGTATVLHELGHLLGLRDSGVMNCFSLGEHRIFDLSVRDTTTTGCEVDKYGNPFDPMGGGAEHYAFEAYHRLMLGWLPQSALVSTSNSITVTLTDSMQRSGNRALRLILDDAGSSLYLEYRTPNGINDPAPYGWSPPLEPSVHISYVPGRYFTCDGTAESCNMSGSLWRSMYPAEMYIKPTSDDFYDSSLGGKGIRVRVTGLSSTQATVKVTRYR